MLRMQFMVDLRVSSSQVPEEALVMGSVASSRARRVPGPGLLTTERLYFPNGFS
jgi:hypothetical protein